VSAADLKAVRGYAAGTELDHFVWWARTFLVQSQDRWAGRPLQLEPWQRRVMAEALAVDEYGLPYWQSVALVVSRKNGKTAVLAAYALYRLLNDEGSPEILLAAASDRQAGRLFDAVVAYVRQNQELAAQVHLRDYVGEIARVDGGGKILRMANDPATLHGYSPSVVVADELHAWTKPSHRRAWAALTSSGGARELRRQVFTISTAGEAHERETSILGQLIDGNEAVGELETRPGLTISRNRQARVLCFNYSAPTRDPRDVRAMKLANPASWITKDYLRRQAANPELTDGEVLQLHGCVWASGVGAWIPVEAWDGCLEPGIASEAGAYVVAGVDIGLVDDSSAVACCWWLDDDRVAVDAKVWAARPDSAADVHVPGGVINLELIEDHLRELHDRYRLLVVYDPRYFERSAALLAGEGLTVAPLHQSSAQMADALEEWHQAVLAGRIAHPGNPVLTTHALQTQAVRTDRGWKVSKMAQHRKIDAHVAAVMAHYTLLRNPGRSVYDERGMLAV
jgi:phage terminase large subunit-like protein